MLYLPHIFLMARGSSWLEGKENEEKEGKTTSHQ